MAEENTETEVPVGNVPVGTDEEESIEEEQEFVPPKDGSWIPRERFDGAIGKLKDDLQVEREARIRLEERQKANEGSTKRVTRTNLLSLVEEGQISQSQADEAWEKQIRDEIKAETKAELHAELDRFKSENTVENTVTTQMRDYKRLVPEVMAEGSEERVKIQAEVSFLLDLGLPNSSSTELAALRNVFGPLDKLAKRKSVRETHQEIGGGEKPEAESSGIKKITKEQKQHYQKMIDVGMYKNWNEVKEELKYARK